MSTTKSELLGENVITCHENIRLFTIGSRILLGYILIGALFEKD